MAAWAHSLIHEYLGCVVCPNREDHSQSLPLIKSLHMQRALSPECVCEGVWMYTHSTCIPVCGAVCVRVLYSRCVCVCVYTSEC